uniref:Ribonuclease H-like domain-containing protein n=1 Tax=Tanacetum cinerariifolium TaxID=118510 RepID=A0A6L2MHH5_TANCI|nr:ribonuclease H-like domain-containing protein [Tanacetum cinerariifolium]
MHYSSPHPSQGVPDLAPANYGSQPTTPPSAFSTMTFQDPTWNMDIGDLYPVTKPSTIPTVFLSTSASTWHQRLGHPGDEVLRSLVSHSIVEHWFDIIHFNLLASLIWRNAIYDEYNELVNNGTWLLVPRPAVVNMVLSMWLFKHNFHVGGNLSRYKARLVANGSSQQLGVDFNETFSPVVKPATIRKVLRLAMSRKWPIHQLDVKNAFLNGDLSETVYMHQPADFVDARQGSQVAYLLIYVDDIILTASSLALLQQIIHSLHNEFDMTDLGALNYFLGISANRNSIGLFLSRKKYALQLLELAHMVHCNPSRTPVDTESKLGSDGVCLYMHDPREPHFAALKRILRYVRGTVDFGLQLYASATTSLVGYTDADWAAKRQHTLSHSNDEAEYRGVANVVAETTWLHNLLRELHSPLSTATLVYCDNVRVLHVPYHYQYVDIFTKGLPLALFE